MQSDKDAIGRNLDIALKVWAPNLKSTGNPKCLLESPEAVRCITVVDVALVAYTERAMWLAFGKTTARALMCDQFGAIRREPFGAASGALAAPGDERGSCNGVRGGLDFCICVREYSVQFRTL